ncbi:MAG TPA: LCP family protein, partial [Actinomycetes bacterium]|nr:LCP family protein [Actinomycetes bacterium]
AEVTRPRRTSLAWLTALALVAALAAGLVVAISPRRPATAQDAPAVTVQRAHAASATPTLKRRVVLLTIGSDSGAPRFGRGGSVESGRADALQLVIIDTVKKRGSILSFPRDSYVPIPGHGTNKINAAMSFGGPRLLVTTFEQLTGLTIDYYALTSFDGLTDIVNKVGKVQVNVDMNLRDSFAGAFLDKGRRNLTGGQALAYARARKTLPGGDFDRSRHQGQLLQGGLATFQRQVKEDPAKVMTWLGVIRDEVKTDLPFPELLRLALLATDVPASRIKTVLVPSVAGSAGGASVVRLLPGAYSLFGRLRAGKLS